MKHKTIEQQVEEFVMDFEFLHNPNDEDELVITVNSLTQALKDTERRVREKIKEERDAYWKERVEKLEDYIDETDAIFLWLSGENGDFPDLSKKPHYSFRSQMRKLLNKAKETLTK